MHARCDAGSRYAAARVIGRSLSERSRMDLAKLRSGVLDVWRRVITNEVDVLGATYDLVQKARAKAAVAARKRCVVNALGLL